MTAPDVRVEIAFDSGWSTPAASRTWTDVSAYVEYADGISIGVGRGDELSVADANTLSLTLNNTDGRFTPGKTSSPYYPDVKIGRPIRVYHASVTANTNLITNPTFEAGITGWVAGGGAPPTLAASTAQAWQGVQSLRATWDTGGVLPQFHVTVSGMTIGLTYTASCYVYVPTGSPSITWILPGSGLWPGATTVNDAWTRITMTFTATATSLELQLWPTRAPVAGELCYIDGAMVNLGASAVGFNDSAAAESSRFVGYITSWPVAWEGTDAFAKSTINASSRLARLGADAQLRSVVEEEFLRGPAPSLLYVLGEPSEATSAADLMGGPRARQVSTGTDVEFGNGVGPGTDDLPAAVFAAGKGLRADVDLTDAGTDVWMSCAFSTSASADQVMVSAFGALVAGNYTFAVQLQMNTTGNVFLVGSVPTLSSPNTYNDGETHLAVARLVQNGANIDGTLWVDGVSVDTGSTAGTLTLDVDGFVIGTSVPSSSGTYDPSWTGTLSYAGLGFTNATTGVADWWTAISDGFAGETPGRRIQRYAEWAGVADAELEVDTGTPPMSHIPTTGRNPLDLMRVVERTEGGALFDAPDGTLVFQHRGRRYIAASQFTIEADEDYLEADYLPTLDDSRIINTTTAASGDGSIAFVAVDSTSYDAYGPRVSDLELFTTDEEEIRSAAWWAVNSYAEPATRVPTLSVNLLGFSAADQAAILGLTVGSRITVTGLPTQAANTSEDYFVEGYTETSSIDGYVLTFNVSPGDVFLSTWVLDSATRSQLDTTTVLAY